MQSIRFTGLEFTILCAAYGRDRLPYPLQYRTDIADFDELKRHREAAVRTLLDKYATEVEHALAVLVEPDARVECKGFAGPELSHIIRFHGAIRDESGVALVQQPGTAPDTGADLLLTYCAASDVAKLAVSALPPAGAGSRPPVEVRREQLAADRARHIHRAHDLSVTDQLDRIFKRPRLALGEVMVFAGAALDSRPAPSRGFWWMDYDDGRYYVKTGDPIVAKPATAAALATEINRLTVLTQRYHREDREHDEYLRSRR